jgi:hypothetical protein
VPAAGSPSPKPGLFAERLRTGLPAPAAADALLQRGVLREGASVEAVEGAATLPPVSQRQAETAGSKPPLSGAPEGRARTKNRRSQGREGHPYKIFFRAPFASLRAGSVTAPDATTVSGARGGRPCSGSVPRPAAALWSEFSSGRGAGASDRVNRNCGNRRGEPTHPSGDEAPRYRPDILRWPRPSR